MFIWAIVANTYKKYLRKKSRVQYGQLNDEEADETDFVQGILQTEQYDTLHRELALLSKEYRECTLAYYFEGLSCAETASKLHISLEMVKYYLFKTRKILKEGISMERELGIKSYQPAKFDFRAVFSGSANMEYQNMFNRKLPGNILLSIYYTPMTIRQLAIELGVASVYLEDEIALLEKYQLLTALPGGRYQARLVIFTEEYMNEFYRTAEQSFTADVCGIIREMAKKLTELRALQFAGSDLEDNRLLWDLLFEMTGEGWRLFRENLRDAFGQEELYSGLTGTCYGNAYEFAEDYIYITDSFAGYCRIDDRYVGSYADYRILPAKNRYTSHASCISNSLNEVLSGQADAEVPVFNGKQKAEMMKIFQDEIMSFARLYEKLYECALSIMQAHAPEGVRQIIDSVMANVLLFHTVGLIGVCAVKAGALAVPEDDQPLGGFIYCNDWIDRKKIYMEA